MEIGGKIVRPFIVADSAFPLLPNMLKCYEPPPAHDTPEFFFNSLVIRARRVVENAFGRLKGRWRLLLKATNLRDPDFLADCTVLSCLLHNYCQHNNQTFDEELFIHPSSRAECR